MRYLKAKQVRQKIKELGKRCNRSFLAGLNLLIEKKIVQASRNCGKFKTLRQEDLV